MKKILLIPSLLTIGLAPMVSMVSCNNGVKPRDITLNKTTLNLLVGQAVKLTATVEPAEASQEIEWSSSNPDICTVENGEVKAIAAGKANITVKPKGYEIPAVCIVNVKDNPIGEIVLEEYNTSLGAEQCHGILSNKKIILQPQTNIDVAFTIKFKNFIDMRPATRWEFMAVDDIQTFTIFSKFVRNYDHHFYINGEIDRELEEQSDTTPYTKDYWFDAGYVCQLNTSSSNLSGITNNDYISGNIRVYNNTDDILNLYLVLVGEFPSSLS